MKLTRRKFLKLCSSSAIGLGISQIYIPEIVNALEKAAIGNPTVIWIQGGGDSGDSMSLINSSHPKIAEVLMKIINLKYHPLFMAGQGKQVNDSLFEIKEKDAGRFILIVEGAVQTANGGLYCIVGEKEGKPLTFVDALNELAPSARAILAVGTCAAYGGVTKTFPNLTGAMGVGEYLKKTVINIPGCPAHPDWIIGTLSHILLYGMPELDSNNRPLLFFKETVHDKCTNYSHYVSKKFAVNFSQEGCLLKLGCRGPIVNSDCAVRKWNSGVNWCVQCGGACIGCCHPDFPDIVSAQKYSQTLDYSD